MGKGKKLVKNTAILSIGKMCTMFVSFFLLPVYTAYLSTEEYGIVELLSTLVSFLIPIITLQLEQGAFRLLIDNRDNEKGTKTVITTTMLFMLVSSSVYVILFLIFSNFIHNDYKYFLLTNVIGCLFFTILLQVVRGIGKNSYYAKSSLVNTISSIIVTLILIIKFKFGVYGMLIGTLTGYVAGILYLVFGCKIYSYISPSLFDKEILKQMIKYSLPLIPNIISWWVVNVSDRTLVTYFLGVAQTGILSAANKFPSVLVTLYTVFNMAWTESAAVNVNSDDKDEFFSRTLDTVIKIFGFGCILLVAIMPFAFPLFINAKFSEAYVQIPILVIGVMFNILDSFTGSIYVANKRTKEIAKTSILAAIINIVINVALINFIGLYAASVSTAIAYMAMFIYRWFDLKKYINLSYDGKNIIFIVFCFIVTAICYYINKFALNAFIFVLMGCIAIYVNRNNMKSMFNMVKGKIKK